VTISRHRIGALRECQLAAWNVKGFRRHSQSTEAAIARRLLITLGVLVLVVFTGVLFIGEKRHSSGKDGHRSLFVFCAAGVKGPVETASREYEQRYGVQIELTFGASQTLLANIALAHRGDLYIPADDSYMEMAMKKGLVSEVIPLAEMTAVLAMRKDRARSVRSLQDLEGLELSQANPDVAAIAKLMRERLPKAAWAELQHQTRVFKSNVTEAANDVKLGTVDAAFVWDAMGPQYPELQLTRLPELETVKAKVAVGVLTTSEETSAAREFARYLSAPGRGLSYFETNGFKVNGKN